MIQGYNACIVYVEHAAGLLVSYGIKEEQAIIIIICGHLPVVRKQA
jgi:hypothetical protein